MYKFLLDANEELTPKILGKIIRKFQVEIEPLFKNGQGYFNGTGQAIMRRANPDASRPNNKIIKNYCKSIVDNFQGYIVGNPVTYSGIDGADISKVQDVLNSNDVVNEDSDFLQDALVNGVAYELVWVNEDADIRFKTINPRCVIPIYSDTLDERLLYVVFFYPVQNWVDETAPPVWNVSVYTDSEIYTYEATNEFNSFTLIGEPEEHHFNDVPFVIFELNKSVTPIFEPIVSLQDAYNNLLSDEVNDFEAFVDCYLLMKNITADEDDLAQMKATRTILIDGDSDVSYLTKNINDTQINSMLENINASIHTVSNSPDFSSEEFNSGVSSGIALQFKLVGFNNLAGSIEARFRKALQYRLRLINDILGLIDTDTYLIDVTFKHNLPVNILDTVNMVNSLRGLVSDETLLAQLPFIKDVEEELARVREEEESFGSGYGNATSFSMYEQRQDNEE